MSRVEKKWRRTFSIGQITQKQPKRSSVNLFSSIAPHVLRNKDPQNIFAPFSSRRAKRAGWPKGLKGPVGAFRPFGPVGVLRRRLLHRNGNFVPLAP